MLDASDRFEETRAVIQVSRRPAAKPSEVDGKEDAGGSASTGKVAADEALHDPIIETESTESCSCKFGNPCAEPYVQYDEQQRGAVSRLTRRFEAFCGRYGCDDWSHRFEVAKENGWKGHS